MRRVEVLRAGRVVLSLVDEPGPITSTAPPPPDGRVVTHPFLSAAARDAASEWELKCLLDASTSFEDYVARLGAAGFVVREP